MKKRKIVVPVTLTLLGVTMFSYQEVVVAKTQVGMDSVEDSILEEQDEEELPSSPNYFFVEAPKDKKATMGIVEAENVDKGFSQTFGTAPDTSLE